MRFHAFLSLALGAALPAAAAEIDDLQASYDFLVRERAAGGALLTFSIAGGEYLLPASYFDSAAYWGRYVCENAKAACAIADTYNPLDFTLTPGPGAAGEKQVERVNVHNGANIYDAATWQIAVMLGAVKGKLRPSSPTSAYALASSLTEVLRHSGAPSTGNTAPGTTRAVTTGTSFVYNGTAVAEGRRAFAFRTMAPDWLARDPLMDSPYAPFISAKNLPTSNPAYAAGKITWTDWKPIMGENAWAFLIGPLQAAHIHYIVSLKGTFVPFKDPAVQNALDVLPTFAAMQSAVGGVYYAPAGTLGNAGAAPVNPYQVSVENNFSLYAGLRILYATLRASLAGESALAAEERTRIADALRLIDAMINGGRIDANRDTKGLLSFFKNAAWRNGAFVQGGLANDPAQGRDWVPATEPLAVDVQTWGIAALGTKQIDAWFGAGAAFEMWQRVKTWGAYGMGQTLWGVGYSDRDGNGIDQNGAYRQGVLSGEWTAGAINAVRSMISAYGAAPATAARLKEDEAAMLKALNALRIDQYPAAGFPGTPPDYSKLIPMKTKPYLYASRRHHIPFGWYANPLPSTASTAWAIMIATGYNPFAYGGAPN